MLAAGILIGAGLAVPGVEKVFLCGGFIGFKTEVAVGETLGDSVGLGEEDVVSGVVIIGEKVGGNGDLVLGTNDCDRPVNETGEVLGAAKEIAPQPTRKVKTKATTALNIFRTEDLFTRFSFINSSS